MKVQSQAELNNAAFTVVHTVDSHRWLEITRMLLTNATAGPVTIQLCFVPDGDTPVQANAVLFNYTLAANTFIEFGEGQVLLPNSTIQGKASAANSLNLFVSGIEEGQGPVTI